jgi:DNA-binding protein HU-beta
MTVLSTIWKLFSINSLRGKEIRIYLFELNNIYKQTKTKTMNKAELVDAIASDAGLSKADAKKALDAFVNTTTGALKKGDRISLIGFGSFSVSKRSARTGRNPQTGKEIQIAAKNVVKFKAGADLAKSVN